MRFIPSHYLMPGMILAKNLYGSQNEFLLVSGTVLTESLIEKIKISSCDGAYITNNEKYDDSNCDNDGGSGAHGIAHGIISAKLKENTVDAVRSIFTGINQDNVKLANQALESIKHLLDDIIDEISNNNNVLVDMVDLKDFDEYTYYHSVNVAALAIMIGVAMKMDRTRLYKLGLGAILHDIGKIYIPKEILNKNGPLAPEEFMIVKKHCQYGSDYLKKQNNIPLESIIAVLTHHERYDSKGYPFGLPEKKQILEGKIISVCDNYDAMTSDRPYRPAFSPPETIEYLLGNTGVMFDPEIIEVFVKKIVLYPVGATVNLSNGEKGVVIKNYPGSTMRPKICLCPSETHPDESIIYDLSNDPSLYNVTITGINKTSIKN